MTTEIIFHESKVFENIDYSEKSLRKREFYKCDFIGCDFTKSDLRENSFEDCTFEDCNFSMTEVGGSGFRNAEFIRSKILGVDFTRCNTFMFSFRFESCVLDYCTFFGTKLRDTAFIECSMKEVDFTEADLTSAVFTDSDLSGAVFSSTILEKADFRGASGFSIDPQYNQVKKTKFTTSQLEGLLYKYQLDVE